jgi:hypothetical protein
LISRQERLPNNSVIPLGDSTKGAPFGSDGLSADPCRFVSGLSRRTDLLSGGLRRERRYSIPAVPGFGRETVSRESERHLRAKRPHDLIRSEGFLRNIRPDNLAFQTKASPRDEARLAYLILI